MPAVAGVRIVAGSIETHEQTIVTGIMRRLPEHIEVHIELIDLPAVIAVQAVIEVVDINLSQ